MRKRFNPLMVAIALVLTALVSVAVVVWHGSSPGLRDPRKISHPTASGMAQKKTNESWIPPINPKADIVTDKEGMKVVRGVLWVVWKKDTPLARRHALLEGITVRGEIPDFNFTEIGVGEVNLEKTKAHLEKLPEVDTVMEAYVVEPSYVPQDSDYPIAARQWPYLVTEAEQAWDVSKGKGSRVAVIDGGFQLNHPDLQGAFLPNDAVNYTTDTIDKDGDHGTHVSGIIGMRANNIGLMGIAPESKIIPMKVFTYAQMADAIRVASSTKNVKTISMSMGINWWSINRYRVKRGMARLTEAQMLQIVEDDNKILMPAAEFAHRHDVAFVHSAGNDAVDVTYHVLTTDTVINVANIDKNDGLAPSSNYGDMVTLGAPGTDIWSTVGGSKYRFMSGTSMAAPMVAGTVALMRSVNPKLTVDQVIKILKDTARSTDDVIPCLNVWEALLDASNQYGIKGKVLDEDGNPVAGISVQPKGRSGLAVKTKEDGTFVISAIPRSNPVQLEIINDKGEPVLYDLGPISDDQFVMRDITVQVQKKEEASTTTQVSQSSQAQLYFRVNLPAQDEKDSSFKGNLGFDIGWTDMFSAGQISGGREGYSFDNDVHDMRYTGEVSELAVGGKVSLDVSGFLPESQSKDDQPVPVTMHLEGVISEKPDTSVNSRKIEVTKLTVDSYTIRHEDSSKAFYGECRTLHYEYDPQDFADSNSPYYLSFEIVLKP